MKKTLLSTLPPLLVASLLSGAEVSLQPLAILSSSISEDELRSTKAVEIFTKDDIASSKAMDLYEFLTSQSSLMALPSYGNTQTQKLDLRGFGMGDGYQNIVITLNGRRLNNIDMTPQLLSNIPLQSIKRIEVLKSSGVVEHGDGANAGVLNIITDDATGFELSLQGGSYTHRGASVFASTKLEDLKVALSGSMNADAGVRTIRADGIKDKNRQESISLDLAYDITKDVALRAGVFSTDGDLYYGGSMLQSEFDKDPKMQGSSKYGGASVANRQIYKTDGFTLGSTAYLGDATRLMLDASYEDKRLEYESVPYSSQTNYDYYTLRGSLLHAIGELELLAGAELFDGKREQKPTTFSIANSTKKQNYALFAKALYSLDAHTLSVGARSERVKYSYDDATQSLKKDKSLEGYELGYNYALSSTSSLFASYAYSYQAPDIDRFFNKDWLGAVSFNGFIDPSKARSYNAGYNALTNTNKFKLALFYTDVRDEIYYDELSFTNTNITRSHKWGVDLYDKLIINDELSFMLNYNYTIAKIKGGNYLPNVAKHTIKGGANYEILKGLQAGLHHTHRSKAYAQDDFTNSFAQRQKAYNSTDFLLSYTKNRYEIFAKFNNIFASKNAIWVSDDAIYPINYTTKAYFGVKMGI